MTNQPPRSVVREVDGQLVLIDLDVVVTINAVNKHNCKATFKKNEDRVLYFSRRMDALGESLRWKLIVILNVNDRLGGALAEVLMPGHDWQQYRDRGEVPFARGLAGREPIQGLLDTVDQDAAKKLREITGKAVVVMDHGAIEVFEA